MENAKRIDDVVKVFQYATFIAASLTISGGINEVENTDWTALHVKYSQ